VVPGQRTPVLDESEGDSESISDLGLHGSDSTVCFTRKQGRARGQFSYKTRQSNDRSSAESISFRERQKGISLCEDNNNHVRLFFFFGGTGV
jgi:hypothetical protein